MFFISYQTQKYDVYVSGTVALYAIVVRTIVGCFYI